ncbi:MAG: hypothetical protein IT443_03765 [Phycisphaeraceae bacterium]|nr:hypothetical protein [Phycisphaeraceae bacterium]
MNQHQDEDDAAAREDQEQASERDEQEIEELMGEDGAWRPQRGMGFWVGTWAILIGIGLCVGGMVVLLILDWFNRGR